MGEMGAIYTVSSILVGVSENDKRDIIESMDNVSLQESIEGFDSPDLISRCLIIIFGDRDRTNRSLEPFIVEINKFKTGFQILKSSIENETTWVLTEIKPNPDTEVVRSFRQLFQVFETIRSAVERYSLILQEMEDKKLNSIQFLPEHKQAGVQILNYFQETLNQKYPKEEVTVRLSQKGNTVTMEIQTPDGKTAKYEKAFADYEMVITGKKEIEEYLENPADQLALKLELKNAHTRLEMQRDLMLMKDQIIANQSRALDTKESRIAYFESELSKALSGGRKHTSKALDIASQALASDEDVKKLVATFEADLKNGKEEEVKEQVKDLEEKKPGILKRMLGFGSKAATKGGEKFLSQEFQDILEALTNGGSPPTA